ncbi:MAG TPA: hypothetical protein VK498_11490 [Ferruginibacter sp.]|nr:hypothetical protein [Ferruginibacter sp.]
MRSLFRILSAAVIISIISCSKSSDTNNPTPTNPPVYLSKIFVVDTTLVAPFDTTNRGFYLYDAQKRPVRAESVQTNATGQTTGKWVYKFFYNGTDTLASSSIEEYTYYTGGLPTTTDKDTTNYTFVNGRLTYDSVHGLIASGKAYYSVKRYTYLAGNMITVVSNSKTEGDPVNYSSQHTIRQNFTNGDISYQLDTTKTLVPAFPVSGGRLENTINFLTNPNPFARLSDPVRRPYLLDDIGIGATRTSPRYLFSQHSYVYDSWTGINTNHNQGTIKYTYTFRPDGYPSMARETSQNGKITRAIFVYE